MHARRWRLPWWSDLGPRSVGQDLLAGAIIAALLVPQSMAYAMLAGLPAQVGLYAALLPPVAYALFGSSRYLAVGPVAVVSLMTATATSMLAARHDVDPVAVAASLAVLSGIMLFAMGLLRLGLLTHYLSQPVLTGFMSAAAILIALSQLPHVLGITVAARDPLQTLAELAGKVADLSLPTLLLAIGAIALIRIFSGPLTRALGGRLPHTAPLIGRLGALCAVALGIALAWLTDLSQHVALVGAIPTGLPRPTWPGLDPAWLAELAGVALLISLVGMMESVSVGRALASRDGEDIRPDRELLGLGAANLAAGISTALPVTGGLSRSLVAREAGARSPLAGVFAAGFVLLVLLLATPLLAMLPRAVLAAIILLAVLQLIELRTIRATWRYDRADAAIIGITFAGVLVLGVELGLVAGIGASLVQLLWRIRQPHIAVVGRVPGTEHFRNTLRHAVETLPDVALVRVDGSLQFPNSRFLRDYLLQQISAQPRLRHVVLVCSAVNTIDSSALEVLDELVDTLAARGVRLHLSEVKGPVLDRLQRIDFPRRLAPGEIFFTTHDAYHRLGSAE